MAVDTPSDDHQLFSSERKITATLRGGTRAMRLAGKKYLPQEPKESPTAYSNRVRRSVLTNFYRKTVDKFSGKITKKAPEVLEDTPDLITDLEDNIDNQGNSIAQVTEQALTYAIDDGVVFMFVDSPTMPTTAAEADGNTSDDDEDDVDEFGRTRAQDEELGLRPYVRTIQAKNLIGWKHRMVNGKPILDEIRIAETVTTPDPEDVFNEISVPQIRQVKPFVHWLWQEVKNQDGKTEWQVVEVIPTQFEVIPLVPLYTSRQKFLVGEPLFIDLGNMNITHWQSDSDQMNITHVIRVPILFGRGLTQAGEQVQIEIGPNSLTHGDAGSDLKYVEHTGKAVEQGSKELDRLETNMTRMGAEIIMNQRTGQPTATARALDQVDADSEMATISTSTQDAWQEVFLFMAVAFGIEIEDPEKVGVNMNMDFGLGLGDLSAVKELLAMRTMGDLSQDTLWFELKRYGILSEDFVDADEKDLLESEEETSMDKEAQLVGMVTKAAEDAAPDDDDDGSGGFGGSS